MNALFTTSKAQLVRSPVETITYTGWPFDGTGGASSLSAGTTALVAAQGWNDKSRPTYQASVDMIQASQNAGVALTYSADQPDQVPGFGQAPGTTTAARGGLRQTPCRIAGVDTLQLNLVNSTGGPLANWQTNLAVTMRRLTAAEKLLAQRDGLVGGGDHWYDLSPQEAAALQNLGVVDQAGNVTQTGLDRLKANVAAGFIPLSAEKILQGFYGGRIYQQPPDFYAPVTAAGLAGFTQYRSNLQGPTAGRFPVLRGISFPAGTNAILTVDRDGQTSYVTLQGAAFADTNQEPWPFFLPAMSYLNLNIQTGPGGANGAAPVLVEVATVSMSEILAVWFGRVTRREDLDDPFLFDMAVAGMFA